MKLLWCLIKGLWQGRRNYSFKKGLWLAILIVVLQIPMAKWKALSPSDRDAIRTTIVTEFCRMYHEKKGVQKFKIHEDVKNGKWRLHITPMPDII